MRRVLRFLVPALFLTLVPLAEAQTFTLSLTALSFNANAGTSPSSQTVTLTNSTASSLAFTLAPSTQSGGSWLSASATPNPAPGRGASTITVSVNSSQLPAGPYTGSVKVTAGVATATITVNLTKTAALTVTTDSPLPDANVGRAYSPVTLTASGGVPPYTWSATGLPPGLNVSASGVISGTPTFVGAFNIVVTVKDSTGATANKTLSLNVFGVASLTVSPILLSFTAQTGQRSQAQSVHIQVNSNTAAVKMDPSYDKGTGWLAPSQSSSSLDYNVTADAASLTTGTYTGTLTVSCTGQTCNPAAVPVKVTLTVTPAPVTITTNSLDSATVGSSYSFTLGASGGVPPYTWSATGLPPGLSVSTTGVISGTPTVVGTFNSVVVTVRDSTGASANKTLSLTVNGVATLTVSPISLSFTAQVGQRAQAQSVHIQVNSNTAAVKMDPSYDKGTGWLAPSQLPSSLDYNVTADASSLAAGTYTGNLTVSCTGQNCNPAAVPIKVTFVVTASQSKLSAKPASLTFQAYQGRAKPASQSISLTSDDGSPVAFTVTGTPSWAQISPTNGTASSNPAGLTVTANVSALSIGQNTDNITITPTNGTAPVVINVVATLSAFSISVTPNPPAAISLAPGVTQVLSLDVATADGLSQNVTIAVNTTSGGNWLKFPGSGINGPGRANVTLDTTGLAAGNYSGTVTFSCAITTGIDAACGSVQVPVGLTVSSSNTPTIRSVISASAFGGFSAISPGTYIEIYGANLSSTNPGRTWGGNDFTNNGQTAPTSLDGTTVSVGGQPAFVFFVSSTQVNALVPSNAGTGPSQVILTSPTGTSAAYPITINPVQPGLLAPPAFQIAGKQYVAALLDAQTFAIPAGSIPGVPSLPAKPGDTIVIYGVGFGPVNPQINAGTVVSQANSLTMPLQMLFGNTPAQVAYSGLAPSFTGLYQFNVVVPSVADNDAVPLTFNLGGVQGAQTLYIAVHR